jgi:hypothetical protein
MMNRFLKIFGVLVLMVGLVFSFSCNLIPVAEEKIDNIEKIGVVEFNFLQWSDYYNGGNMAVQYELKNISNSTIIRMEIRVIGKDTNNSDRATNHSYNQIEFEPNEIMIQWFILGGMKNFYRSHKLERYEVEFEDGTILSYEIDKE